MIRRFAILIFVFAGLHASAGWMANADFSSCPRKYFPNTSAKEGPFASESECNSRIDKARRESPNVCARYTCVNETGTASGGTGSGGAPMDTHIQKAISAGVNGQISSGEAMTLVGFGMLGNALLAQPSPEQIAARREAERQAAIAAAAAEAERQRLIKEREDKMDAEAAGTLALLGPSSSGTTSDEDLLRKPAVKKFDCEESLLLAHRLEKEGLKKIDINVGKTQKMIKQAEEGSAAANKELAVISGEALAGKLADKMKDFATNQDTIRAMEKKLQELTAHNSVSNADTEKLKVWLETGIESGNSVIDSYEALKKSKKVKMTDVEADASRERMLEKLGEFNDKFMNDTGAWELAGEHLSKALGPAGPVAFKTAVLGIKLTANRGAKMISENDLNEQKYHLGNMMKTRAEMAQKIKNLRKRHKEECSVKS